MKLHDTITAIATPIGTGGIAILRLSGTQAIEIAQRLIQTKKGKALADLESHKLTLCQVHKTDDPTATIDEALVVVMRGPNSYTGETVVEIHCHGGFFAAGQILENVLAAGARLAEGGEFTRRAFLNGKTDLVRAEATMDVIDSNSGLGLENAARSLTGLLAEKIQGMRDKVASITAHISAAADYPEEVEALSLEELELRLGEIKTEMEQLLATFETGRILRDGITTVIVGRPNVGKSSLLNALSRSQRAIVTDIPGTTRDVIEAYVRLGGVTLRLLDTAGIRDHADTVEQIGIDRANQHMEDADLCLFVIDSSKPLSKEDIEIAARLRKKRTILLLNKTDCPTQLPKTGLEEALGFSPAVVLETAIPNEGESRGIEQLEKAISKLFLTERMNPGQVYLSNARQRDALEKALSALSRGMAGAENGMPYDLLFVDLEDTLTALGEMTGATVQEEIIDLVFSRFCVGK